MYEDLLNIAKSTASDKKKLGLVFDRAFLEMKNNIKVGDDFSIARTVVDRINNTINLIAAKNKWVVKDSFKKFLETDPHLSIFYNKIKT